jgi:hypothetical protein
MPPPLPEDADSRSTAKVEGGEPPADRSLLEVLRVGLSLLRIVARQLNYAEVSKLYFEGWIEDKFPNATDEEKKMHFELFKDKLEKDPDYYAHRWSTELREFLKQANIEPKTEPKIEEKLIFRCDKRNKCYRLANGWHPKEPLLSKRSARTKSAGYRDFYKTPPTGKTPIHGPETDHKPGD